MNKFIKTCVALLILLYSAGAHADQAYLDSLHKSGYKNCREFDTDKGKSVACEKSPEVNLNQLQQTAKSAGCSDLAEKIGKAGTLDQARDLFKRVDKECPGSRDRGRQLLSEYEAYMRSGTSMQGKSRPPMELGNAEPKGAPYNAANTDSGSGRNDPLASIVTRESAHDTQMATANKEFEALLNEQTMRDAQSAQSDRPDQTDCQLLVQFRDTELYGNWAQAWQQMDKNLLPYEKSLKVSTKLERDLSAIIKEADRNDVTGRILYFGKISVDLSHDLLNIIVPEDSAINALVTLPEKVRKFLQTVGSKGTSAVNVLMVPDDGGQLWEITREVISEINPVTKSIAMAANLLRNASEAGDFMRESEEERNSLRERLHEINASLVKFKKLRAALGDNFKALNAVKNSIDQHCKAQPQSIQLTNKP